MNLIFALNQIALGAWMPVYLTDTIWGFGVSLAIMLFILATNLAMMTISMRNKVWWPEMLTVRMPFTLYSGWITAATILSVSTFLKSMGMYGTSEYEIPLNDIAEPWLDFMMFMPEEAYGCITLWVAFAIYEIAAWSERNPVFGSVFTWASIAVLYYEIAEREARQVALIINASIILLVHLISMGTLTSYLIFEEF